jgi:hypothetical protein
MSLQVQAKSENHEEAVKLAAPPVVTARWLARNSRNSRNSQQCSHQHVTDALTIAQSEPRLPLCQLLFGAAKGSLVSGTLLALLQQR